MSFYKYKPLVVEVVQWDGMSSTANAFLGEQYGVQWEYLPDSDTIRIPFYEFDIDELYNEVNKGDWIVKYDDGCHDVYDNGAFHTCFEEVNYD